jgi:DNA invertase Pin-like site-specific DNA recombinase
MATVGYIRVSSSSQNAARQLAGIEVDKVFEDTVSGKDTYRPGLNKCLDYLREGDILVVHSIDRLARSLTDLQKIVEELTSQGVSVKFMKEGLEFSADHMLQPMQKMLFQVMGAFAEFERSFIRERQQEGINNALAKGKNYGRPQKCTEKQKIDILRRVKKGDLPRIIAKEHGISPSYLYKLVRNHVDWEISGDNKL